MERQYIVLAYYLFVALEEPHVEVQKHKNFFSNRDCTGRIYISQEGINGQMSGAISDAEAYMAWLKEDSRLSKTSFRIHLSGEHIFPHMSVKFRPQLVAFDQKVDVEAGGEHVAPEKWKEMLTSGEYLVLDVRNQYEWEIGHFEGARLPPLNSFREFPEYAEKLKGELDPDKTKVMMYCTGGIRCEIYSALLKKRGFDQVFQLEGGVINYGLKEGSAHWKGKLFVFDDRLAIAIDGKESEPIASCIHCKCKDDTYYNCANMDCNELFICCPSCLTLYQGSCSHECKSAPRVRSLDSTTGNKPFKRKHLIACSSPDPRSDSASHE